MSILPLPGRPSRHSALLAPGKRSLLVRRAVSSSDAGRKRWSLCQCTQGGPQSTRHSARPQAQSRALSAHLRHGRAGGRPVDQPPSPSLPGSATLVEAQDNRYPATARPGPDDNPPVAKATDPSLEPPDQRGDEPPAGSCTLAHDGG